MNSVKSYAGFDFTVKLAQSGSFLDRPTLTLDYGYGGSGMINPKILAKIQNFNNFVATWKTVTGKTLSIARLNQVLDSDKYKEWIAGDGGDASYFRAAFWIKVREVDKELPPVSTKGVLVDVDPHIDYYNRDTVARIIMDGSFKHPLPLNTAELMPPQ
jgi:hypothetical protein